MKSLEEQVADLKNAIAAQENLRATLGDAVVDATIAALREKLAAPKAQREPAEQVRKTVTVLFADVSGFTAMAETMDAEQVTDIMNALWQRLDAAIVEHGGRIDKHMGDAVMALWGVESAREDDPERAIRAALAMQSLSLSPLSIRIGINTGPVVLGGVGTTGEFTAMGDAVNLASRLEHAAPLGGVLISHDTFRLVRGIFDVLPQEPIAVKGKAEPIRTYIVRRAKARAFRMGTRGVEGVETRMVGRDAELLTLQNAFHDAMEDVETSVVTVGGEAGVGKSRLLYEFDNWIDLRPEPIYYFKGRAAPALQHTPYSIFRDLFVYRFEILDSDSTATAVEKFRAGMASILEPERADLVGHLVGFDFSASPAVQRLLGSPGFGKLAMAYLTNYIRAMAERQPTVIFLEDLHWADDSSLDLVDHLSTAIPKARLLIVCLARSMLFEQRPHWGEGRAAFMRIDLQPLSRRASRALVDEILQKAEAVPDVLRDLIVDGAEGNPFYVEELVKMLIDEGVIMPGEERWRIMPERLKEVRVPPTLTGILQARLDSLPREERESLQRAAVVGRIFWDAAVAELIDAAADREKLDAALDAIRARELVFRRERSAFAGVDEYIFKHALLRDVAYETVLLKLRRGYHARVARWLEAHAGERLGEYLGLIAEHYMQAGEDNLATIYLERSGDQALRVSLYRQARDAFQRVLSLSSSPSATGKIHLKLGEADWYLGDYAAATAHLEPVLTSARQQADSAGQANALYWLSQVATSQGDYARAQSLLMESLPLARAAGQATLARVLYGLGDTAWRLGDLEAAWSNLEESLEIARALDDATQVLYALNRLGAVAGLQQNLDTAQRLFEECRALALAVGHREREATALMNLGEVASARNDYAGIKQYTQAALEIVRDIGQQEMVALALINLSEANIKLGDLDSAWRELREGVALARRLGTLPWLLAAVTNLAQLQAAIGDTSRALALLGLVKQHPAASYDIQRLVDEALARLRLDPAVVEAGLARGATLVLDTVVAEILAE
jgi:class 3 adenylate cyclase/tetratricopeptide (TPR) repeat protein